MIIYYNSMFRDSGGGSRLLWIAFLDIKEAYDDVNQEKHCEPVQGMWISKLVEFLHVCV